MANFTQLHLGNKTQPETLQMDQRKKELSKQKVLFGSGLLAFTVLSGVFLLITNGCSKGPAKVAADNSQNLSAVNQQMPMGSGVPSAAPVAPATGAKTAHTRVQKKAPLTTYSDPRSGVSFRYPKNYVLKTGDEPNLDLAGMGPVQMNFVQPGGTTVAAIELPRGAYPGTDFSSAYFSVSVHPELTAEQCGQFSVPLGDHGEAELLAPTKVKVAGNEFDVVQNFVGSEKKNPPTKSYHRFENGNCYEFGMGLGTVDGTESQLKPVNRARVFRKLEQILATVKMQPVVVPEVAKGTPAHPMLEGSKQ
jgi:hypothetical protein